MSVQINFGENEGISFEKKIHSYTDLMQQGQSSKMQLCYPAEGDKTKNDISVQNEGEDKMVNNQNLVCDLNEAQTMQEPSTQEDIPLIHRVFDRDKAKNFTEYVLSRPTTFAHKCEEMMAGTCVAAILSGIGAIGTIYHSDIIPSHNQIALGFVCAMGICLAGTVLSGVAGGISECWQERKNRLMQEQNQHIRD